MRKLDISVDEKFRNNLPCQINIRARVQPYISKRDSEYKDHQEELEMVRQKIWAVLKECGYER